ncbi:MAG: histidine kinase [Nostoc sp. CreGUA01]|nr:histidine kinase [Nostoc sp. CreGUA01]
MGQGELGTRKGKEIYFNLSPCLPISPSPSSPCPMPHAPCPMPSIFTNT